MQTNVGNDSQFIIADGRWLGPTGIGRFSQEIFTRLTNADVFYAGPKPLSVHNIFWQMQQLKKLQKKYRVFFTPGFNSMMLPSMPYVFTVHDLIHLFFPGNSPLLKKIYYHTLLKSAVQRAHKVLTVSEYSKKTIIEWANLPPEQIVVVGNGVSADINPAGKKHSPGFPYLLHVGNTKPHKNVERLICAFKQAKIADEIRLILTGEKTAALAKIIAQNQLENRVIFTKIFDDATLQEYYRGAVALVFPSLYEGFGLPVIEAMACGTPVLTSNVTSLPEIAGDAAMLVDPLEVDSIARGITKIVGYNDYRMRLISQGFIRAKYFSWDTTASKVQSVLDFYK